MSGSELSAELTMSHTRPFTPLHLRVPREPRGQRCVAGCRPQGGKESDTTEATWQARPRGDALQTPDDVARGLRNCGPTLPHSFPPGHRARKESCVTFAKKGMRTVAPGQLSQSTEASGNMLRANSEDAQAISSSLQVVAGIQAPSGTTDPDTQASSQLETPSTDRRGADDGIKGGTVSKRGANGEPGSPQGARPMRYSKAPQTQP